MRALLLVLYYRSPKTRSWVTRVGRLVLLVHFVMLSVFLCERSVAAQWIQQYASTAQYGNNQLSFSPEVMAITSDGGSIVANRAYGPANERNINEPAGLGLFKLNPNGTVAWQKVLILASWTGFDRPGKRPGGTEYRTVQRPTAIQQTSDGGYVLSVAVTVYTVYPDQTVLTEGPASVLKLNTEGNVEWWRTYRYIGGGGPDSSHLNSIQEVPGGYLAAGVFGFTPMVIKLRLTGTVEWTRLYSGAFSPIGYDGITYIARTNDGGFILANNPNSHSGSFPVKVAKVNADGVMTWYDLIKIPGNEVFIRAIQQTADGEYFIAGLTATGAYALKLKADGSVNWQKAWQTGFATNVTSAKQTSDGGYVIAGNSGSYPNFSAWLIKLDPSANPEWERKYSQDPLLTSIDQTAGGDFIGLGSGRRVFRIDGNGNVPGCGSPNSSPVQPISFTVEGHGPEGDGTINVGFVEVFGVQTIDVNTIVEMLCGVQPAQLEMTKTAPSTVTVGQDLTYTLTIKNKGAATAQAVTFTDPLPSSVTLVSVNSTQGTCSTGNPVTCNMGDLAANAVATVTIVVRPNAEGQLSNLATVSAANSQSVQASASSTVTPPAGPIIFIEEGTTNRAAALDSVTGLRGPFRALNDFNFNPDRHTRVIFFTSDLGLTQPDASVLSVRAGGFTLTVENVGPVAGIIGLNASYIIVRLPDGLPEGDLPLIVTLRGLASVNSPTLAIASSGP